MSYFFQLPNEILGLILSNLDPFQDFQTLVFLPQFKPLIDSSLCVLTDDLRLKKESPFHTFHLATYEESIHNYQYFIINICAPVGEAFLPRIINTMIFHKRAHFINFQTELLPRGFFNQAVFNGNEYTAGIKISNAKRLGSAQVFEKFYDSMNFSIDAPNLESLYVDFGNRKAFLKKFKIPNLKVLEVKSSHLSSNCVRDFTNLVRLGINSFSDLEDLELCNLEKIKLSAGYSLMMSNCKFPKLKTIDIHPDARLPGIVNCELDSLEVLDIQTTRTSYIKNLHAPNLRFLSLNHTIRGILNTLVLDGGCFPSLEKLVVPSPVYLAELEHSQSLQNVENLKVYIQKEWFYPTVPMYLMKDDDMEVEDLSLANELDMLLKTKMDNVKVLSLIIENTQKLDNSRLQLPDLARHIPQLETLRLYIHNLEPDDTFDIGFLKYTPVKQFCTNISPESLIGFDEYQVDEFNTDANHCISIFDW